MSGFVKELLITSLICLFIAAFTNALTEGGYWLNLRIACAFGWSIILIVNLVCWLPWSIPTWASNAIGLVGGFTIGMVHLMTIMFDEFSWDNLSGYWSLIAFNFFFSFVICGVVFYLFVSTYRLQKLRREVAEQAALTAQKDHQLAVSELKLLQSQIEPHFLFNTLATLQGLVDTEPQQAKQMIKSLASMLRVSLQRSRSQQGTLAQEFSLIGDYLDIQKIRLGGRLTYSIQLPDALAQSHCPPLLLQPLVENAVVHGIEPSAAGGEVTISAQDVSDSLQLEIRNTGVGFGESKHQGHGMGIQNVRERLHALFKQRADLQIQPLHEAHGTRVQIRLPRSLSL